MAAPGLLVIGASQWKYASLYAEHFCNFNVSIISQSGMKVDEVNDAMVFATGFFEDVVIHLGTNNLIGGESPEEIITHHKCLIQRIRAENPGVRLYLSSVLFRGLNKYKHYSMAAEEWIRELNIRTSRLNSLLCDLASRMDLYYVDNWKVFCAASPEPKECLLSRDGLHLTSKGIQCLLGSVVSFRRAIASAITSNLDSTSCVVGQPSIELSYMSDSLSLA